MPPGSTAAYLERHRPEEHMRHSSMDLTPTLFGRFALVREWGRVDKGGQHMEEWHGTLEQACGELERLAGRKRRKGLETIVIMRYASLLPSTMEWVTSGRVYRDCSASAF